MREEWQPSITVDPGPYKAVIVEWAGLSFTILAGPRRPEERRGGERRPVKIPRTTKPPVTAFREVSVSDALDEEPGLGGVEGGDGGGDIRPEHMPVWYDESAQFAEEEAVPTTNARTIVRTFRGTNTINLDEHADLLEEARRNRAEILIRFADG